MPQRSGIRARPVSGLPAFPGDVEMGRSPSAKLGVSRVADNVRATTFTGPDLRK